MGELSFIEKLLLWIVPIVFAITLHEVAHGLTACYFGDSTAKNKQRLSLNPIKHIDPVGSLLVPAALLWFSGFVFGWAKPVPVNANQLKRPKTDMIYVAAAGPLANVLMAIFWGLIFNLGLWLSHSQLLIAEILIYTGAAGVFINCALMTLNLLPILPLDGGRILNGFLPQRFSSLHNKTEILGLPLLLILMLTGTIQTYLLSLVFLSINGISYLTLIPSEQLTHALLLMM